MFELSTKTGAGGNKAIDEANYIFDFQAEDISKPKEEAEENIMKTEMY